MRLLSMLIDGVNGLNYPEDEGDSQKRNNDRHEEGHDTRFVLAL